MARFSNGWVKIDRSIFNGNYDKEEILILIWLICRANYVDGKTKVHSSIGRVILKRGQLLTSANDIAKSIGLTWGVVNRRLKAFSDEQIIIIDDVFKKSNKKVCFEDEKICSESDERDEKICSENDERNDERNENKKRIITIVNYNDFQENKKDVTNETTNETTNECETNAKQNDERMRNECETNDEHIKETKKPKKPKTTNNVKEVKSEELIYGDVSSPTTNGLISYYCEKYKQRFKINPVITGKEAGAAKNITKTLSVEKVKELIDGYFSLSDSWIVQKMYPLDMLQNASLINRIMAKKEGIDVSANKAKEFEKQTEAQNIINRMFGGEK